MVWSDFTDENKSLVTVRALRRSFRSHTSKYHTIKRKLCPTSRWTLNHAHKVDQQVKTIRDMGILNLIFFYSIIYNQVKTPNLKDNI